MKYLFLLVTSLIISLSSTGQNMLGDLMDSITMAKRNIKLLSDKFSNLTFSGYIQPQFQLASEKGVNASYQGGEFAANSNNRFRLRRGRLRADYQHNYENGLPATYFVFQFDGTEQGVNIRDFWGRYYENKWNLFAISAGMMARPFGHELQLSSSARESAERGRMSQILMKTERDLGVMVSLNPRLSRTAWKYLQFDLGIFNGQGLAGPREFDNKKDLILHLGFRPSQIKSLRNFTISGGLSMLRGGLVSELPTVLSLRETAKIWKVVKDSSAGNIGRALPRNYYGADLQVKTPFKKWQSVIKAEFIRGDQTATQNTSVTPGEYPKEGNAKVPYLTRPFNGAYFNFIQDLAGEKNKLILKYDWYDPNTRVSGGEIVSANGQTEADIKYNTFGFGYLRQVNEHLKILFWYDQIKNESTLVKGYEKDLSDNVFTLRAQFMF